jgi:CheY-like chemotaxis protein
VLPGSQPCHTSDENRVSGRRALGRAKRCNLSCLSFVSYLHVQSATVSQPLLSEKWMARNAHSGSILVVGSDNALQKILQRLLSSQGYEVEIAPSSLNALRMLRQRPPAAVILDLPHAESHGHDLCRNITNLIPGLPVLVLSASPAVAQRVLLLKAGAQDYVTMPFSPRELAERLSALLRSTSSCVCTESS